MLQFDSKVAHQRWLEQQSCLPAGFRAGVHGFDFQVAELGHQARMTMTLLVADAPTSAHVALYTQNAFVGAPVQVGRQRAADVRLGAIVVNNKIANVCAPGGVDAALRVCDAVGSSLGIDASEVLPCSTGVIGWQLPVDALCGAAPAAVAGLQDKSVLSAAEGIMTTDLYPKVRSASVGQTGARVVGIAKGAGMVEPNLATMLVFLLTDLDLSQAQLRESLGPVVARTFNALSVDSDQSTSDSLVLWSSQKVPCGEGAQGQRDVEAFEQALQSVCASLAQDVVRNGEGVHHVMEVSVSGAPSEGMARHVGKAVVNSPLVQCAICGNDANVGRLVMAVGKALPADADVSRCTMSIGGHRVFGRGAFEVNAALEAQLHAYLKDAELYASAAPGADGVYRAPVGWPVHERNVRIEIDLGMGAGGAGDVGGAGGGAHATVWGGDRSHEYISENADYRS